MTTSANFDFTYDDRIATIAACSSMGRLQETAGREEPLGPAEWSEVAQWLQERGLRPAALLDQSAELDGFDGLKAKLARRLIDLPARASLVSLELERFENRGIWSLVRFDEAYPRQWRDKLKNLAPPVLFGAGPVHLLSAAPSLAIVGSRNIDERLQEVAAAIGRRAAAAGHLIVSGGAKGSDRWGMAGALAAGREAVGVLHGDLLKDAGNRQSRQYIEDGLLCLAAHVHPSTGFVTGNAMARNRYIHALANATVVVAATAGSGGTWQGSIDNLQRHFSPLLVWSGPGAPPGNAALIDQGAFPLADIPDNAQSMIDVLDAAREHHATRRASPPMPVQTGFAI